MKAQIWLEEAFMLYNNDEFMTSLPSVCEESNMCMSCMLYTEISGNSDVIYRILLSAKCFLKFLDYNFYYVRTQVHNQFTKHFVMI